jgi:hypothetical protein
VKDYLTDGYKIIVFEGKRFLYVDYSAVDDIRMVLNMKMGIGKVGRIEDYKRRVKEKI